MEDTIIYEIKDIISENGVINIIQDYHTELHNYRTVKKIMAFLKSHDSLYLKNLINFFNRINFLNKADIDLNNRDNGLIFLRDIFNDILRLDKKYINEICLMFEFKMLDERDIFCEKSYRMRSRELYNEKKKLIIKAKIMMYITNMIS